MAGTLMKIRRPLAECLTCASSDPLFLLVKVFEKASAASNPIPLLIPVMSTDAIVISCVFAPTEYSIAALDPDWGYSKN